MDQVQEMGEARQDWSANHLLAWVRKAVQPCIQCGTCTASCPNEFAMDKNPRQLWRMVLMDEWDEIFKSKTFSLCSYCYYCTLRCPRGLPLTEVMATLKQAAAEEGLAKFRGDRAFYKNFLDSVRRHGRVNEMEFMSLYFLSRMNPALPFKFLPLGLKLMAKGKVSFQIPTKGGKGSLDAIFRKVEKLEASP